MILTMITIRNLTALRSLSANHSRKVRLAEFLRMDTRFNLSPPSITCIVLHQYLHPAILDHLEYCLFMMWQ